LNSSCALVYPSYSGPRRDTHGHLDKYHKLHKNRKKRRQLKRKNYPKNPRKKGNGGFDKNGL